MQKDEHGELQRGVEEAAGGTVQPREARSEIIREYDLTGSTFDKWVKRINLTGSSHDKDNRTPEEHELLRLRKENQQLWIENDVLKQAALPASLEET